MAETTKIAWCHHTLNFWEGCTKVSPGCDHCYAEARNKRFSKGANWGPGAPRRERMMKACEEARRLNRKAKEAGERRRVFVNSLSDFFDNEVPGDWRAYALGVMRACDWLDFILLTKRIGNVEKMIEGWGFWPLPNVLLAITVVTQEEANRDIPKLLRVAAARRGLSIEPQLQRVDLCEAFGIWWHQGRQAFERVPDAAPRIDWVITGGESGPHARPYDIDWARAIVRQCRAAGVSPFVKQLGSHTIWRGMSSPGEHWPDGTLKNDTGHGHFRVMLKDRAGADPSEWPEDLRVQEFPE